MPCPPGYYTITGVSPTDTPKITTLPTPWGVRHHLWRSWGFCPRHTWAHAIAEFELRVIPLGTTILYKDLLNRARHLLGRRWQPTTLRRSRLRAQASCYTCDYISTARQPDPHFAPQQSCVNNRRRFTQRVLAEAPIWLPRACPGCSSLCRGLPCRQHLILIDETVQWHPAVLDGLNDLADRLDLYLRSMTWGGPQSTVEHRSALVETLGWFAGWEIPLTLANRQPQRGGHADQGTKARPGEG